VILRQHEKAGTTDSDEYLAATEQFYDRFVFHHHSRPEMPECSGLDINLIVYEHMWGPTEFYAIGNLRNIDVTDHPSELDIPVLFIIGRYDEARPETVKGFMKSIPGSKLEIVEGAAHAAMLEEPEQYVQILRDFVCGVEQRKTE
jgi:proline iminopeptidase